MYLESELTTVHDFVQVLHDDGDDPEQVHLGLGLVRVDALVRIVSSGKTGRSFELIGSNYLERFAREVVKHGRGSAADSVRPER